MDPRDESLDIEAPASRELDALAMRAKVASALFGEAPTSIEIGRYTLMERLGAGGMGVVYAARDESLGRRVAVKVLKSADVGDERRRARLLREAQALAKLSDPHVVQVYEVGEHDGGVFVAMELVEGTTLGQWQQVPRRSDREILDVYLQAGRGLRAAHRAGLVHRDFKPNNVLVGADGRVRVLDFGLARGPGVEHVSTSTASGSSKPSSPASITQTGTLAGTEAYMAPEQLCAEPVDARADQFALCVSLYEALVGVRPFEPRRLRQAYRDHTTLALAMGSRRLPWGLRRALGRGLALSPAQRWPDMDALLDALTAPARWTRRVATWSGPVVATLGLVAWASVSGSTATCDAPSVDPATMWRERAPQVLGALEATEVQFREQAGAMLRRRLDAYAAEWTRVRAQACGEPASWRAAEITACLDRDAVALRTVLDRLEAVTPSSAIRVESILGGISAPSDCLDEPGRAPEASPPTAAQWQSLVTARTRYDAGEYPEALVEIEALLSDPTLPASAMLASARALHGRVLARLERFDEAERALARAQAEAGAADPVRASAGLDAFALAVEGERWDAARQQGTAVDQSILAAGDPPRLRARWLDLMGRLSLYGDDDPAAAAGHHRKALVAWSEAEATGAEPSRSRVWLANALAMAGERDEAAALYEQALQERAASVGTTHPDHAAVLFDLGMLALGDGDFEAARGRFEPALAVERRTLGPASTVAARTEVMLSRALVGLQREDEALRHARSAWAVQQSLPRHSDRTAALRNLAVLEMNLELLEPALEHHLALAAELGPTADMGVAQNVAYLQRRLGHCEASLTYVGHARSAAALEHTRPASQREYDDDTLALLALYVDETEALAREACGDPSGAAAALGQIIERAQSLRTRSSLPPEAFDALVDEARAELQRILGPTAEGGPPPD